MVAILIAVLITLPIGIGIGVLISNRTSLVCKHEWKSIKEGEITNYDSRDRRIVVGFMRLKECSKCKKMKGEKVYVNDEY